MSWGWGWRPYVSSAQKRANAARAVAKMTKRGQTVSPVNIVGRKIVTTFWGKAWCDNLESYSDYENRLPRGRTYVRNGSVVDLQITEGHVTALVSGSELYKIEIKIQSLPPSLWKSVQRECAGKIDSLIELLQGRLSTSAMAIVTRRENGLFPKPAEISMNCSCPDWAGLCKHLAASLYGVGARLDEKPELLFLLRGVDAGELISHASAAEAIQQRPDTSGDARAAISEQDLAEVFGIDLDSANPATSSAAQRPRPSAEKRIEPKAKHKSGKQRSRGKEKLPEILISRGKPRNSKREKTGQH